MSKRSADDYQGGPGGKVPRLDSSTGLTTAQWTGQPVSRLHSPGSEMYLSGLTHTQPVYTRPGGTSGTHVSSGGAVSGAHLGFVPTAQDILEEYWKNRGMTLPDELDDATSIVWATFDLLDGSQRPLVCADISDPNQYATHTTQGRSQFYPFTVTNSGTLVPMFAVPPGQVFQPTPSPPTLMAPQPRPWLPEYQQPYQ